MALTVTKNLILPSTVTGSWPRPRWFDVSMWARPLDTCMMDVRFREKFQDALAVVISDEQRAGLDILTHGDFHCDEDFAGRSWHHLSATQRWAGFDGDYLQSEETRSPWLRYPPRHAAERDLHRVALARVTGKIELVRSTTPRSGASRRAKTRKPVRFGTCCSQVMGLFLDIHTGTCMDNREVVWDMAVAMNKELLALRDAGCRCIPDRGADAALHGEYVRRRRRKGEVHGRVLQPRGPGARRRRDLDPYVLGNPNIAGDGGHELQGVVRVVSERAARRCLDD